MASKKSSPLGGISASLMQDQLTKFAGLWNGTFKWLFGSVDEIPEVMEILSLTFDHCQGALFDGISSESDPVQIHPKLIELINRRFTDYKKPTQKIKNSRMYLLLSFAYICEFQKSIEKEDLPKALKLFGITQMYFGLALGTFGRSKDSIESIAKKGAVAMLAKSPKQKEKELVRDCWNDWQKQPIRYKGKAAFARDMREKFPNLDSQPVIERWCREWNAEKVTQQAQ